MLIKIDVEGWELDALRGLGDLPGRPNEIALWDLRHPFEPFLDLDPEALRQRLSIVEHSVRALMAVPLQTDNQVIGLIYVDSPQFPREFTSDDLNLLTVMANVAAIRIERDRLAEVEQAEKLMASELEQAAEIQRQFLPSTAPVLPGLELAGYNAACRTVGGDYYDFLPYPDNRVGVVIGDVAGKGMPAALMMTSLQAKVQALAETPGDPGVIVGRLNRSLVGTCPANRFITFFFAIIDASSGDIAFCNAGHNPPFLVRAGGGIERLEGGGPVLGILPAMTYQRRQCHMEPGDLLVLYSDGVTEAATPAGEEFEDRLPELAARLRHCRAQFRISKRPEKTEDPGGHPDHQHHGGAADLLQHDARHHENCGSDHGAGNHGSGAEHPQAFYQLGLRLITHSIGH